MSCYYFGCGVYENISFCDILCMYHMDCMISFSCQVPYDHRIFATSSVYLSTVGFLMVCSRLCWSILSVSLVVESQSPGVGRKSWLFGVVVAAVVFSACARFVVSYAILSWLWPHIPNCCFKSFSSGSLETVELMTCFWSNSHCSVMFQCGLRFEIVFILFLQSCVIRLLRK